MILSTTKAEYVAMVHEAKKALQIITVLDSVHPHHSGSAVDMYEDNEGENTLSESSQGSHLSKHVDVRFHFLRELVRLGQVTIRSVISTEQLTGILTKPLGRGAVRMHRDCLINMA